MKKLFSILCAFIIIASTGFSQTPGTVTINVTGNKTKQVAVDNTPYTITTTSATGEQAVVVNNLAAGSHELLIVRNNQYNKSASTKTSFTLREGYDLVVTISSNGSVSQSETRINNWKAGGGKSNFNTAAYNKLYTATKQQTSSTTRSNFLEKEFTTTNKKMTAKQASTLIQLVNSESLRLKLAKLSYPKISDQQNFSLVSTLLSSTTNRTVLNDYIAALPEGDDGHENSITGNTFIPLSNEQFQVIYNEVQAESSTSDKNYYLSNFFAKDFNYYTSAQAGQLIQLISTDPDRYYLTKIAYRGVTDRENYGEVVQLVTNLSNRAELRAYMSSYDMNNVRPSMTSTDFNKLYQSISYQNSYTTRYNSLVTAFSTQGNYFTVAQAKQLIPLVSDENSRLLLSKSAYKVLVDRVNYTQFNEFLSSQSSRNELSNYAAGIDNTNNSTGGTAMNDVDFNKLYKSMGDAWSASSRFNIASSAFQNSNNYFTTYQVRQLLILINSETDRLSLAKSSYDNITDQYNYSQLYELFSNTTNKNDLAKFVSETQSGVIGGTVVKTPMTATEFNGIVRDVQFTFGIGAKMGVLSGIFNKETNFFTVQQAKQLIQMVSAESNRLELAKAAYNNITDPANFTQLYDIFSTQTSKDELNAYVGSNAYINR
ncbi:MAG: DUF4476 domain-containing protein [Ferruginibacter sp.]|nr:DUF4476 domain-containing protein [Chitinophagaceae bacterium]